MLDLTWPQVYLLLDGGAENAPVYDDAGPASGGGQRKSDKPPKPDEEKEPVEFLRWQLKWNTPDFARMSEEEIEVQCERLAARLKAQQA